MNGTLTVYNEHLAIKPIRGAFLHGDRPVIGARRGLLGDLEVGGECELLETRLDKLTMAAAAAATSSITATAAAIGGLGKSMRRVFGKGKVEERQSAKYGASRKYHPDK